MNKTSRQILKSCQRQAELDSVSRPAPGVRLRLQSRPCGEVRLSRHRHQCQSSGPMPRRRSSSTFRDAVRAAKRSASEAQLVCSDEVPVADKAGWGRIPRDSQFTRLAKYRVRDAAALIEKRHGKQVVFATGTLPGSTYEAMQGLARFSGMITARVEQWLRTVAPGAEYVIVWERQKRGALHIHFALGSCNPTHLRRVKRFFKRYWFGVLARVSDEFGVDLFGRKNGDTWRHMPKLWKADCKNVRKSIGRYMSKYLSKGGSQKHRKHEYKHLPATCPSAWFGMTRALRQEVIESVQVAWSPELAETVAYKAFHMLAVFIVNASENTFYYEHKIFATGGLVAFPLDDDVGTVFDIGKQLVSNLVA